MKRIISVILVLVMACALFTGCAASAVEGNAAASSDKTYNLAYQCAWGTGGGPYQYASELAEATVSPF